MAKKKLRIIFIVLFVSLLYFLAIAFDITPYLRGPAPYPPDWRWPYEFVNTLDKIWFPLIVFFLIFSFLFLLEKKDKKNFKRQEKLILVALCFFSVLFQISILYFSRAGINVLIHRIINPDLNGYFTASLGIENIVKFFRNYNSNVLSLPQHAQGHPPGAILLFWVINKISLLFPANNLVNNISPSHNDVRIVWESLKSYERQGALLASVVIPILSSIVIIPIYQLSRYLYGQKVALYSVFLYIFIPSVVLFVPINDVFLPLFTVTSLLLFLKGLSEESKVKLFFSGLVLFLGIFFSISLLPIVLVFMILFLLNVYKLKEKKKFLLNISLGTYFTFGFLLFPIFLLIFFSLNFLELERVLMSGLPEGRDYLTWAFFNLYDFFIFLGIPILIIFLIQTKNSIRDVFKGEFQKVDKIFFAFTIMLLILNFSGSVRGEVARIWIPFIPIVLITVTNYAVKNLKLKGRHLYSIIFLQAVQIIFMQEFWVPIW